jgi:hypothetical protein
MEQQTFPRARTAASREHVALTDGQDELDISVLNTGSHFCKALSRLQAGQAVQFCSTGATTDGEAGSVRRRLSTQRLAQGGATRRGIQ